MCKQKNNPYLGGFKLTETEKINCNAIDLFFVGVVYNGEESKIEQ